MCTTWCCPVCYSGASFGLDNGGLLATGKGGRVGHSCDDSDITVVGQQDKPAIAAASGLDSGASVVVVERKGDHGAGQHHRGQAKDGEQD